MLSFAPPGRPRSTICVQRLFDCGSQVVRLTGLVIRLGPSQGVGSGSSQQGPGTHTWFTAQVSPAQNSYSPGIGNWAALGLGQARRRTALRRRCRPHPDHGRDSAPSTPPRLTHRVWISVVFRIF
ncbi:hypothetical protein NDU88_003540 [Pleurodeles waltl]|uniref:Uncharacterized protein n=1 Tax=Pleurodeles waltl TaxID=8319 RepID=A0AAV7TNV9_PLEWA|nr:hypothetical protein NDU88_003540 [Pleurodeles waltl]